MWRLVRQYSSAAPKRLSVIGSGQMGVGIAYVAAASARSSVTLIDNSTESLDKGIAFIDKLLAKNINKAKITENDAADIKTRISRAHSIEEGVPGADIVIEAVPEVPDLKLRIFEELARVAGGDTILGTNTSSISISRIAAAAKGAESRVIGIHFMNPVPVQPGVELIRGIQTSDNTVERTIEYVLAMGKKPSTSVDSPGFLANRLLMPYINEAAIALETGVGGREDIDSIMVNGCAMPMGPLKLADFIGLDTCLAIMKVLHNDTGDTKYRPSVLLAKMVDAGYLGVKSGKGFYDYE